MHGRIGDWQKTEIKADPLTLTSFIDWLETKPSDQSYNYNDCEGRCLYGLYMAHHGISWENSGACGTHRNASIERYEFCQEVYNHAARPWPWTFGAALIRARAALSSR